MKEVLFSSRNPEQISALVATAGNGAQAGVLNPDWARHRANIQYFRIFPSATHRLRIYLITTVRKYKLCRGDSVNAKPYFFLQLHKSYV